MEVEDLVWTNKVNYEVMGVVKYEEWGGRGFDQATEDCLGYHTSGPLCGERTLTTAQKLSERTNRARIISICPLHNIVGV